LPKYNGRRSLIRRVALGALLVLLITGVVWVVWLDVLISREFRERGWTVPAQVYAKPLMLRPGLPMSGKAVAQELERLGYRESREARPGTYRRDGSRFDIVLRRARFAEGVRESASLRVVAGAREIVSLQDPKGRAVPAVPLEPQLIGNLHPVHGEDRVIVAPGELPPLLPAALKAIEDRNFDSHAGVDFRAISRAAWANLRAGRVEQGGSTLTQQLVKSYFLDDQRSMRRKAQEAVMAMLLEARYNKTQLMHGYINEIYLGQDGDRAIHGFGLASRFYFGKALDELGLPEIALLVGIVRGPSFYNPRTQPQRATERRNFVLARLAELKVVTTKEAAAAAKKPLGIVARKKRSYFPAYLDYVRRELQRDFGADALTQPGLNVFTSLEPRSQEAIERAVATELGKLDKRRKSKKHPLETAIVVTLPDSGEVVALLGGRQALASGFNRALDAKRPIGSLVKPVVYLAALETGRYHAASILDDSPIEVRQRNGDNWRPQNFDREMLGPLPLVRALADSRNLATVQLGMEVGLGPVSRKFRALGLDREPAQVPSMLLGAVDLAPIEVAQLYNAFANGGMHRPLHAVRGVVRSDGRPLPRRAQESRVAADPVAVYQLDRLLVDVMTHGTGRAGSARLPAGLVTAGKTGTSSELRDSWFAGFSGDHLIVAWIGHDDNAPTGFTGSQAALPLWANAMGAIAQSSWQAPMPNSLEEATIDYLTGYVPDPACAGLEEAISIAVPRNTILVHAQDCRPSEFDSLADRLRDWWQRVTD
jgi:penicillin-binding protein 1B